MARRSSSQRACLFAALLPLLHAFPSGGSEGQLGAVQFPLRPAPDGRRLQDVLGRPFLVNGDAAWSLMVALTKPQVELYLEDRRQRGFNTVLVNLIERGFGGPENQDGELPFVPADDFTAPNEAYFAHADWVIDKAAEKGMLVMLAPAYLGITCGSQGWCDQMLDQPVSAMLEYGRFLGDRYRSKRNILWIHGGDTKASGHGASAHVDAIVEGIQERAPNRQLHSAHCSRNNSAVECYDLPWLDVNNSYSRCSSTLDAVREDYDRDPPFLFFYIEGNYENSNASLGCLIDQHAWSILGGATGHVFGNTPIWRFGDGWEDALASPGSQAMAHLGRLFLSRAWFRLEPDTTGAVLTAGTSDAAAAVTSDGESIVVYVPSARTITVDATVLASSTARGWYFDPANGSVTDLGAMFATQPLSFSVPGRLLLVLDTIASELPAPGSEPYPFGVPVPGPSPWAGLPVAAALCAVARLVMTRRRAAAR
jgi:hypothetical protein